MDIVIPIRADDDNEELRFVLRSIAANVPHRDIYLAGHKPSWSKNVQTVDVIDHGGIKYAKSRQNTMAACGDDRISDDFILFNDDFFVMKPIKEINPVARGKLIDFRNLCVRLGQKYQSYVMGIDSAALTLMEMGCDSDLVNFEVHQPQIFNKDKRLAVYNLQDSQQSALPQFTNTFYGNLYHKEVQMVDDLKIQSLDQDFGDEIFVSTTDDTFENGIAGAKIREIFPHKCRFEI